MKIKELVKLLSEYQGDMLVVISKDSEGNRFSPLDELGTGLYVADTDWSGTVYNPDETKELEEEGVNLDKAEQVLVLWPRC